MKRETMDHKEHEPNTGIALAFLIFLVVASMFARCKAPEPVYYPPGWRPWPTLNPDYQKQNEIRMKQLTKQELENELKRWRTWKVRLRMLHADGYIDNRTLNMAGIAANKKIESLIKANNETLRDMEGHVDPQH